MRTYQGPRGMRDLLPAEAAQFDALQRVVQSRAERYGYPRLSTPIVEDKQVFLRTAGETSDAASKEMYEVSLHGSGDLALRPEGTAPVSRALLEHGLHKAPLPQRFFYWEPMFRGQRPQLLRYRQFWQWGLECYGAEGPAADLEIIEFSAGLLNEVGLTDVELVVNTIGDGPCRAKVRDGLVAYFEARKDELSAESQQRLGTNVLRILDSKDPKDRAIAGGAPKIRDLVCDADRAHFDSVVAGLERVGISYTVSDSLVRGLDYYTRTVFEFWLTDPEYTKSGRIAVGAGGRYDGLVETMGGPAMAGVGIAGGVDVLLAALAKQGVPLADAPRPDVYVLSAEPDDHADRVQLAIPLREAGFRVAIDYSPRALEKQLETAVKHGARVAVIRGTPEARGGNVIVRDLEKKEQVVKRLAAVVTEVGRHVPKRPRPTLGGGTSGEGVG